MAGFFSLDIQTPIPRSERLVVPILEALFRVIHMKLILSPKDNVGKMTLDGVQGFALEGETLLVVFENGRTRNYPLMHLWYYESHVDFHKTATLSGGH